MIAQSTEAGMATRTFRSMNTDVSVTLPLTQTEVDRIVETIVRPVFEKTERACSRFITGNPLHAVNTAPSDTHSVPEELYRAVNAAYEAYQLTNGLFDPRVLTALQQLGYRDSFETITAQPHARHSRTDVETMSRTRAEPWQPTLSHTGETFSVNLGGQPIDLGGIAKGYTVDVVTDKLKTHADSGCLNAGGDIQVWGSSAENQAWRIGVENPLSTGSDDLIAVLEVTDTGIATSSARKRQWLTQHAETVHHIIDPRTGFSPPADISSVTVTHSQTRIAETLTKALFLSGESQIAQSAESFGVQALWVTGNGQMQATPLLDAAVIWRQQP